MKLHIQPIASIVFFVFAASLSANDLVVSTNKTVSLHKQDQRSQKRIDDADNLTKTAIDEYLNNERISDITEAYNDQISVLIASQQAEVADLSTQINSLEETDRSVLPMLNRMVEMLDRFVQQDTPFLIDERKARIERLTKLLNRADVSVAEKYRQILEAYSVEIQYGRTFEAYSGVLDPVDEKKVTFLRLGRSVLYYQTLNGLQSAVWQAQSASWRILDEKKNLVVAKAIRMAQQQNIPELLSLPMPEMEK
jgi:hypothetical protein